MSNDCFLCDPDPRLVYAESESFVALLGFGPIVEGYTLLATRDHAPSMFDLADDQVSELEEFTLRIRTLLATIWTAPIITEHGRVGLCQELPETHEPHCFHAHQLVFPTTADFSDCLAGSLFRPIGAGSFAEARLRSAHLTEYLYYEQPDGSVFVGHAPAELRRQFFRRAAAERLGHPEWQSWREHPRSDLIWSARHQIAAI